MANVKQTVSALNELILVCKDGEDGFRGAAEGVRDVQLKSLFDEYAQQRGQFAAELRMEVERLGGEPGKKGGFAGVVRRGWTEVKAAVSGGKEEAVLEECERGEEAALRIYSAALQGELPESVRTIVESQYDEIREARDDIRALERAGKSRRP